MPDKESLLGSISGYDRAHGRRVCSVQLAFDKLVGVDSEDLSVALKDRSITNRAISLALADRDIKVTVDTLKRHRRGECSCES